MAACLDPDIQKLDLIVATILDGKRIGNGFSQKVHDTFCQGAAKISPNTGKGVPRTPLQRIKDVKCAFDGKKIKALVDHCEAESYLHKSDEISLKLRERGNELYKEKKVQRALRAYTLAIAFAPVLSEELAIAYANRSAVLLQMDKPHEAMADVQRSLPKCPNKLKEKLEERAEKCKAMFDKVSNDSNCDEETAARLSEKLFGIRQPNPKIPNAESFVEMVYTPERGRHLIVTEEVPAGSVVLVDQPFISVLNNLLTWEIDHCHQCAKSMISGIHCNECVFAMFCSEECRALACNNNGGIHHLEHSFLPILHAYNATHKDIQALRLVATVGQRFLTELSENKHDLYSRHNDSAVGDMLGFENGVYDCKSYLTTYHLISHELESVLDGAGLSIGTLNALNALFLTALLKEYSTFFQTPLENPGGLDFEDWVSSLILHHLENIKFNAISLSKISKDNKKSISFAAGMYPLLSICNHSCDPNCAPVKQAKYLRTSLISLRKLKKGDELFITYKPLYNQMKTSERQSFLAENYRFICNCQPCEEEWGPSSVQRYPHDGMLILEPSKCEFCADAEIGKNGKPCQCRNCQLKDVQRAKKIRKLVKILFECHDLVENRDYVRNLKVLPEVLNYFGSNGYKTYFSLYYIATDLYKRALVQCVSDL